MNRSHKNKSFIERLEQYDSPVPDDLFARLDINQQPQRRYFGFYFLTGALIFIVLLSLLTYNSISLPENSHYIAQADELPHAHTLTSPSHQNAIPNNSFNIKENETPHFQSSDQPLTTGNTIITDTKEIITQATESSRYNKTSPMEANSRTSSYNNPTPSLSDESFTHNSSMNSATDHITQTIADAHSSGELVLLDEEDNAIANRQMEVEGLALLPMNTLLNNEEFGPTCPKVNKVKNIKFGLELSALSTLNHRVMKPRNSSLEPINYIQYREEGEFLLPSYELSAMIRMSHRSGFSLASGLAYQLNEEKFSYISSKERTTSIKEVYDSQGNIIRRDTVIETGYREKTTYNRIHLISVPLVAGYQVWVGDVFIRPELGASIGITLHKRGEILDENHDFYNISEDPKGYFDRSVYLQGIGKISIGYLFKNNMTIQVSPIYKYTITPMNGSAAPADQFYHRMGIQAGLTIPLEPKNKYKK